MSLTLRGHGRRRATDEIARLRQNDEQLRAALANEHAVSVPPAVRDTSHPADQATTPIDVRPLRDAAAAGRLNPPREHA